MQPKILSVKRVEYAPAPYFGKNESGRVPLGDRVLIRPDIALGTSQGGVELPQDIQQRMQLSSSSGVVVELGDGAFRWNFDRSRPWEGYKPKPGDYVDFERYAGKVVVGDDGNEYRVVDDKSIGSVKRDQA